MKIIKIKGADCKTKNQLFETFSGAFDFPDYFAHNWDSFDEIICDLSWIPEKEITLVIEDYALILSEAEEEDLDAFYDILSNVETFSEKQFYLDLIPNSEE